MIRVICTILLAASIVSPPALAETSRLSVVGEGQVSVMPDAFAISVVISAPAASSAEALKIVSERQAAFNEGIYKMAGLETLNVTTSDVVINSASECEDSYAFRGAESVEECQPKVFYANLRLKLTASPASEAGNLASYASQFSTFSSDVSKFIVTNDEPAKTAAMADAVRNAKAKAARLAELSGMQLGNVIEMSDSVQFYDNFEDETVEVLAEYNVAPDSTFVTNPEAKTFNAKVKMVFELLPVGAD